MKKAFLLILLFITLHSPALSDILPDSLMQKMESIHDSSKALMINNFVQSNYRSLPEMCMKAIKRSIEISESLNQEAALAHSYSLAGVLYKNKGDYSNALEFQHKSLKINSKLNEKRALASNYNDIGIIYKTLQEYDKALESYLLANSLATELELKKGIVMTLNNIGTIYEAKGAKENAIDYYNRAYKKAIEFEILDAQAIVLNNLGDIYATSGNSIIARDYFKETLRIDKKTGDRIGSALSLINIAGTMVGLREWDSANFYYAEAELIAKEMKANQLLFNINNGRAVMYEERKDFQNAYYNFKNAAIFQDSLFNENKQKQLAEVEARFEAENKDQQIQLLKQEKFIKEIEIQQHKAERLALISLLVLGTIIIIFLYKRYRNKQLQQFNLRLLKQKEGHLRAVVEAQEEERKRIAKDLHDGIGQNLSGVRLGLAALIENIQVDNNSRLKISELTNVVDHTIQEVRTLSHQMMPRILQEDGLVPAISDMLEKSFRYSSISYEFEHFGISNRFKENVEIGLYRISQELINNIIKHSGANKVSVQLIKNGKMLILLVEDNGKGFEMSKLKSKGIGLMNISSRVETIHGEFNMEPSPESGTLATIRIPIDDGK
ncbi:MAG: Signal transduction histidine kinase [Bacteroidetes bacterium]|nr:MAG: Signal transduction histidine kinase [Bacteroidota bacterium]